MSRPKAPRVKLIRINHGLLGYPDTRRIENTMRKWMGKGYTLKAQQDEPRRGCWSWGYTLLTFVEEMKQT
jgi:hypothetical protein